MGRGDTFAKGQTFRAWLKDCAPASPIEFMLRSSPSRVMFFYHKSNEQTQVRGGLTGVEMHGKEASIVAAHFRSHRVKQSADTDRESLGKSDPAFVSDLFVAAHVQAGQVLIHLQEVDQKGMVSGLG